MPLLVFFFFVDILLRRKHFLILRLRVLWVTVINIFRDYVIIDDLSLTSLSRDLIIEALTAGFSFNWIWKLSTQLLGKMLDFIYLFFFGSLVVGEHSLNIELLSTYSSESG